ncbi:MAG: molybdenum cofactor guanylyltransferase [Nitrospirota bacterium]
MNGKVTGIILSGGESRRMASEKAFMEIDGISLIENILNGFDGLFDEVIIVTNKPELYISYDAMLVGDLFKKKGPMAGLYSGLLNSRNNYSFVVACDMPFLNRSLISFMMDIADGVDIVIPKVNGLVEPLHAIYSKRCLDLIEKNLKEENLGLRGILGQSKVRYVGEDEITIFDPDMNFLININSSEDIKKVTQKICI